MPVYLSGMARGLLGRDHDAWFRHKRKQALREADLVVLAGVTCDFRLNYGLDINRKATLVSVNRSEADTRKNRGPDSAAVADPGYRLLAFLAQAAGPAAADFSFQRVPVQRGDACQARRIDRLR